MSNKFESYGVYNLIIKVAIVGDSKTGKTSYFNRLLQNDYKSDISPTIGADFASKMETYEKSDVKIYIWDTSGMETYRDMIRVYFKDCAGFLLFFDLTDKTSFTNVSKWIEEIVSVKESLPNSNPNLLLRIALIGHKSDKIEDIEVSQSDIDDFVSLCKDKYKNKINFGLFYSNCSSKTNINVKESYTQLYQNILISIKELIDNKNTINLIRDDKKRYFKKSLSKYLYNRRCY